MTTRELESDMHQLAEDSAREVEDEDDVFDPEAAALEAARDFAEARRKVATRERGRSSKHPATKWLARREHLRHLTTLQTGDLDAVLVEDDDECFPAAAPEENLELARELLVTNDRAWRVVIKSGGFFTVRTHPMLLDAANRGRPRRHSPRWPVRPAEGAPKLRAWLVRSASTGIKVRSHATTREEAIHYFQHALDAAAPADVARWSAWAREREGKSA